MPAAPRAAAATKPARASRSARTPARGPAEDWSEPANAEEDLALHARIIAVMDAMIEEHARRWDEGSAEIARNLARL
jgi:hypothetical protein